MVVTIKIKSILLLFLCLCSLVGVDNLFGLSIHLCIHNTVVDLCLELNIKYSGMMGNVNDIHMQEIDF